MKSYGIVLKIILFAGVISLASCASKLEPLTLPLEESTPSSQAKLWQSLEKIRSDDWFYLLNDGSSALEWRIRAIDSATESIDFQTFLWDLDTTGQLILNHLFAAAERGVRVRLLIDDSLLFGSNNITEKIMQHPLIEYRIFNPYMRRKNGFVTREIFNIAEFHRLDHRMHNKSMIVDNRAAIIGGRNIADEYFGLHALANFRDMELLVGGPIVQEINQGFDNYWNDHWSFPASYLRSITPTKVASKTVNIDKENEQLSRLKWIDLLEHAHTGKPELFIDEPPPKDIVNWEPTQLSGKIIQLIDNANENILIASAYLIPTETFSSALTRAMERGVMVRLLTNSLRSNNHTTAHSSYRHHILKILRHGANLHEVRIDAKDRDRYIISPVDNKKLALHAKVMTVDGEQVFIGSANFDPRSLRINTEMGLLIHSPSLTQHVNESLIVDTQLQNAWSLRITEKGHVQWVSDEQVLNHQPAYSFKQEIEDWFFALLPIEDEM